VERNKKNIEDFVKRLNTLIESSTGQAQMGKIGRFLIDKITVRTRLGYGVKDNLEQKYPLRSVPRSPAYEKFRKTFTGLSPQTTPRRHNLTLTGSMIDSLKIKAMSRNKITIGPTGFDQFGRSNEMKAYWQEQLGRVFLRLSEQEVKQVRIFWIRQFSDLLKGKNIV
jgi:hypothetical protein